LKVVFAVLAVFPDFLTLKVNVQVPFAFTMTEEAVATQAPFGLAFTPTNLTLVDFAVVTPIPLRTVRAEIVPLLRVGLAAVKASSGEYPAVVKAVFTKPVKLLATKPRTARSFISG
jgi:hypothetical protein